MTNKYYIIILLLAIAACNMHRNDNAEVKQTSPKTLTHVDSVFAIIGDYGSPKEGEWGVASLVKTWNPLFIATVGDNSYPDDEGDELETNVGAEFGDFIADGSFFPSPGNHDHANKEDNNLEAV
jgi:hypothetical protein